MRFAITGSHHTGKTTLCHQLVGRLMQRGHSVALATEPSRDSRYLAAGRRGYETQLDLLTGAVRNELEAARQADIVVCDRSLLDVLAYTDALPPPSSPHQFHLRDAMAHFIKSYLPTYAAIFKTTILFNMGESDDPLRIGGTEFQRQIDTSIERTIETLAVPVIRLADAESGLLLMEHHITGAIAGSTMRGRID